MIKTNENPGASAQLETGNRTNPGVRTGLRSPEILGHHPAIGLALFIIGSVLFGAMVLNLQTQGPLLAYDVQIANSLHTFALQYAPLTTDAGIFGFYLGEHAIIGIGAVLLLYFLYKRFWPELCMVVIAWLGEGSIWLVTSQYFHRARPTFDVSVWHQMTSSGFPSGHSLSAIMCYGLVAYLLVPKIVSHFWKIVVIVLAIVIVLFIGFSRVLVGDHYTTDVLAGYGLGLMWTPLVYTSIEMIAIRLRKRKEQSVQSSALAHH